jgi:hypothetical protein
MKPNDHDCDEFDSAGFADYLHDAIVTILLILCGLAVLSPVWLP